MGVKRSYLLRAVGELRHDLGAIECLVDQAVLHVEDLAFRESVGGRLVLSPEVVVSEEFVVSDESNFSAPGASPVLFATAAEFGILSGLFGALS